MHSRALSGSGRPAVRITPRAAAIDLAIVLGAIALAWVLTRWVIYPALGIPDYAPYILRPITGFLAAWWVLHRRGTSWRDLGLRIPVPLWRALVIAVALYAVDYAMQTWAVPVLGQWLHPTQRPSFLGHLPGNATALAFWVAISWLVGGLCEECLFRGFFLSRVEALLGGSGAALALAILAQAVFFGVLHLYGGSFAFMYATLFGAVHGFFYILAARNLWPLIAVHALWDSIAFWGVYSS